MTADPNVIQFDIVDKGPNGEEGFFIIGKCEAAGRRSSFWRETFIGPFPSAVEAAEFWEAI